jgi:hypothetical protein
MLTLSVCLIHKTSFILWMFRQHRTPFSCRFVYLFIYLENWARICESECVHVYYVIQWAVISSTLISIQICLSLARFPIDILYIVNEMATLKCRYIKNNNNFLLKIITDFLNWCWFHFTWPLFYRNNEFRVPTVRALISLITKLMAAHKTYLFVATHYQLIYMNFRFVCLTSGHVSKVIRGYFSKAEGVRKQNR